MTADNHYHKLVRAVRDALKAALPTGVEVYVPRDDSEAEILLAGAAPFVCVVLGSPDNEPSGMKGDKRPEELFPVDVMIVAPMAVETADIDGKDVLSLLAMVRGVMVPQAGFRPNSNPHPVESLGFGIEQLLMTGVLLRDRYQVRRPPWAT